MAVISGKSAIVTGGTRGIGLAISSALLASGVNVLICARQAEEIEKTVREFSAIYGERIQGVVCDVGVYESVQGVFGKADEWFSGVDILVNNAGVGLFCNVENISLGDWNRIIATNLTGVFHFCREAVPRMREQGGGYIINIGSLAGKEAFAGATAYCATKFALVGFSEALMQEVRHNHIKVSIIMPGSVNTSFAGHDVHSEQATWKLLPEDVAQVVLCLLDMEARALPSRVEVRPSEPRK